MYHEVYEEVSKTTEKVFSGILVWLVTTELHTNTLCKKKPAGLNNLLITSNTGKRKMVNVPFIQHLENMISILVWLEILTLTRWEYQSIFLLTIQARSTAEANTEFVRGVTAPGIISLEVPQQWSTVCIILCKTSPQNTLFACSKIKIKILWKNLMCYFLLCFIRSSKKQLKQFRWNREWTDQKYQLI